MVQSCLLGAISGATVTVTQGATTIGTGTTDSLGQCCIDISATGTGTYVVSVAKSGNSGSNQTVVVASCPGTTNVTLYSNPSSSGWNPTVTGCFGSPLAGATITIQGGTYTTNSSGQPTIGPIAVSNGAYTITVSKTRFNTFTASGTISGCVSALGSPALTPATGYVCQAGGTNCAGTADPVMTTLQVSGPVGNVAAVFSGASWKGCTTQSRSVDNCAGGTVTGNMPWSAEISSGGTLVVRYSGGTTKYIGGSWATCPTTYTWSCGGTFGSVSVGTSNCTAGSAVPAFSQSYTYSGLTGLAAIFNGTWTVTE